MDWRDDAACIGESLEVFFDDNPKTMRASNKIAKQYCDSCRVREDCLNYALDNNVYVGIYGGLSNKQRRSIKKYSGNRLKPGGKVGNTYDFS